MKTGMRMNLRIDMNKDGSIEWRLWSKGIKIKKSNKYASIKNALRAAKNVAKQLNIEITSCTYYELHNNYKQSINIGK